MKGDFGMENTIIKETTEILKKLSPKNQVYFMTLVRLAEVAENGVKNEMCKLPRQSVEHTKDMPGQISMRNLM